MLDPIDPVFETILRETLAQFKTLLRTTQQMATKIERDRCREVVAAHEDYDERGNPSLVDSILDEIGDGESADA